MLIDDDMNIRTMYAEVFSGAGFSVEEADDGADGLAKIMRNIPDVVFTGIDMPRMDGFKLAEALKNDPATASIPIIMSSHRGKKEDLARAKEMNIKDFIVFGMVTPRQVVEKIRAIFEGGTYLIKFDRNELDAPKLAGDFHIDSLNYKCEKCGKDLVLSLKATDVANHEFQAKFVCPSCKN